MTIEQEIFANSLILEEKLLPYGFERAGSKLIYEKLLQKEDLQIVLEYDGEIRGRIDDLAAHEEYAGFRIMNATGFSAEIKRQFTDLLLDIREKCCRNQYFKSEQARRIHAYLFETYGGAPDFLWPNIPSYGAYRLKGSGKWYAIVGSVPLDRLDHAADSHKDVEVINVKADGEKIKMLLTRKGYYPAFHMNKKCWVSIVLDDTLGDAEICRLIDASYENASTNTARSTR